MVANNTEEKELTEVISTGTETIDATLGGGIPYRTLMLIEGQSAAGKSTLSLQCLSQLGRGQSDRLDLVYQGKGDKSVGTDFHFA